MMRQQLRIRCSLRVKTQVINNFLGLAVTKANKFQTKITSKMVSESMKNGYI